MDVEDTEYWWPLSAVLAWIICRDPAVVAAACETPLAAERAAILLACRLGQKTSIQAAWRALTKTLGAGKVTAVGDGGDGHGHQPIPATEWRNRDLLYEDDSDRVGPYHGVMIASDDVLRLWPAADPVEAVGPPVQAGAEPDPYRTGFPGRPTIRHLIEQEFNRRAAAGKVLSSLQDEAQALHEWAAEKHRSAKAPSVKTIKNNLRGAYNRHNAGRA